MTRTLTLALCLATPAQAAVSYIDLGSGDIGLKWQVLDAMRDRGERMTIRGICASDRTMALLADVLECVAPTALLGFHGATLTDDGRRRGNTAETGTNVMAAAYPAKLRAYIRPFMNAPHPVKWLTGAQVNQIDPSIRLCP